MPSNHSYTISQTIKYRKLLSFNIEAFKADIINSELIRYPKTNAAELAQQYDYVLHTLISLHAPLVTKKIILKVCLHVRVSVKSFGSPLINIGVSSWACVRVRETEWLHVAILSVKLHLTDTYKGIPPPPHMHFPYTLLCKRRATWPRNQSHAVPGK